MWQDPATGLAKTANSLVRRRRPACSLSQDPLGFGGGQTNLSEFCGNSPTNYIDPTGMFGWTNFWGGVQA